MTHKEIYDNIFELLSNAEMYLKNKQYLSAGTQCKIAMSKLYEYEKLDIDGKIENE
jgi:hypothetical protein